MKDNKTLSVMERKLERERDKTLRDDKLHGFKASRPTAARMVQRVKGLKMATGSSSKPKMAGGHVRTIHPAKTKAMGAPVKEYTRRAVVKCRWVASKNPGQWAAHAKYLERDGAQEEGKLGVGFNSKDDAVEMHRAVNDWQQEGDQRIYKIMLSPEDGHRLDMVAYTRAVMRDIESQVGKPLEWVAIDHNNTAHAHTHILIRGKGIELSPELMSRGIRTICEDHATRALGYKSDKEKRAELDNDIPARRFTQLDRLIEKKGIVLENGDLLLSESGLSRISGKKTNQVEVEMRVKRIARMQHLETMGVAEKVGSATWRLDANWSSALKQLEVMRTRSTMLVQHRELMTDPRALPVVTKLQEGQSLIGRSLGGGLDETDKPYLLVEGMDGRAHFIARSDSAAAIKPGTLIAMTGAISKSGRPVVGVVEYDLAIPARGFAYAMKDNTAVIKAAEDELDKRAKSGTPVLENISPSVGFAAQMQKIIIEQDKLRKQKEIDKPKPVEVSIGVGTHRE